MNYKSHPSENICVKSLSSSANESGMYYNVRYSYNESEWRQKIMEFINEFKIYKTESINELYTYISQCRFRKLPIPIFLLIEKPLLKICFNFLTNSTCLLNSNTNLMSITLIPEVKGKITIINKDIVTVLKLFQVLFDSIEVAQLFYEEKECMLVLVSFCLNRNLYYKTNSNSRHRVCIEALRVVQKLFFISQKFLECFEELFDFSYHIWNLYTMAQQIEIKYLSASLMIPWLKMPGNKRIFKLFCAELDKIFENPSKIKELEPRERESRKPPRKNKNDGRKIWHKENLLYITATLLEGLLEFVRSDHIDVGENGENESAISYALNNNIFRYAIEGILSFQDEIIPIGLQIVNYILKSNYEIDEKNIVEFVYSINGILPRLIRFSGFICHEVLKMLKRLIRRNQEFITLYGDGNFLNSFLEQFVNSEFKWRVIFINFIGHLINEVNTSNLVNILNLPQFNLVEILDELSDNACPKCSMLLLRGIYRVVSTDRNWINYFLEKGIIDVLKDYASNEDFSEIAVVVLRLFPLEE